MTSNHGIRERDPGLGAPNGTAISTCFEVAAFFWCHRYASVAHFVIVVELGSDERLHQLQLCVAQAAAENGVGEAVVESENPRYAH